MNLSKNFKGDLFDYRERSQPFQYDYPIPISKETIPITQNWVDLGTNVVKVFKGYQSNLESDRFGAINKKQAEQWSKHLKDREMYNEKLNVYPASFLKLAESMEENPDPYFSGSYNWYLCGGNVATLEGTEEEESMIVRSFGENHQYLGKF